MKKIVWILVSFLMVLSLVIVSCAPKVVEEKKAEEKAVVVRTEEKAVVEKVTEEKPGIPPPEVPKYGGVLTIIGANPLGWDQYYTIPIYTWPLAPVSCVLIMPDWTKGPAGTGETSWTRSILGMRTGLLTGGLATSWEMPDEQTIVYHLRKGVKWQNIPPVNGREFTAQDVVWNLERLNGAPVNTTPKDQRPISFKALDKYTVEVKVPSAVQGRLLYSLGGSSTAAMNYFFPPEVIATYGHMKDWQNVIGNGPFILKEFVANSSLRFERNPDYWETDPFYPENRLPYISGIRWLVITDVSTILAAIRTGRIDIHGLGRGHGVTWEDAAQLIKTTPLKYIKKVADLSWIWARLDKPELPFHDIRVRRAMNMAIDRDSIVKEYYGGTATAYTCPWPPTPDYAPIYTPLEEQPEEVQELFTYNPEKARKLLAEAGYPNGFKTEIICGTTAVDFLSMIREYFLDIGIDMEIKPLEAGIMTSVLAGRSHTQLIYALHLLSAPADLANYRIEHVDNRAFYDNPLVKETYNRIQKIYGKDEAGICREVKEISKVLLRDVVGIMLPQTYNYTMWWPWIKGYHGEGFDDGGFATKYIWIDEALKKSMGY